MLVNIFNSFTLTFNERFVIRKRVAYEAVHLLRSMRGWVRENSLNALNF